MFEWITFDTSGLVLSFLGSLALIKHVFISDKEAVNTGTSRWSGTYEENLKLPAVRALIRQRRWGILGSSLLAVGFALQFIGILT